MKPLNGNGECGEKDCPNVYRTAAGSFVVQGDVSDAFTPPAGEGLVEIPEAVRPLRVAGRRRIRRAGPHTGRML
ncbi:hypothetical protein ACFYZE_24345 [Streptomyces sp. NPDC001796]|uniref:hypothetical protein n=1 Tax=Streptomyces sp. NPDC001796 TaxID=3364609 RepID=UPI0036B5AB6C